MGILNKIFGDSGGEQHTTFWKKLTTEADLNEAVEKSHQQKVVIFKHSTRCYISRMMLQRFENEVSKSDKEAHYYYLDLLSFRDLSNTIAEKFGIAHQSPQIIILDKGVVVKDASHQAISLSLV